MRRRSFEVFAALFLICIIGFMGINILYFIGEWYPYQKCSCKFEAVDGSPKERIGLGTDFDYKVEMPDYLRFESGFLKIKPKYDPIMTINESGVQYYAGDPYVDLMIMPQVFGPAQMYVSVLAEDGYWQIPINREFEYIPDRKEPKEIADRYEELLREHETEIRLMLDAAENEWPSVFD